MDNQNFEKVLVCITAQSNSKRLIDKGSEIAEKFNGELHILHIEKGTNIFANEDSPKMLQELFIYGNKKGGMVHALSGENIPDMIKKFVKDNKITKIVMGENPGQEKKTNFKTMFKKDESVEIIILTRE